MFQIEIKLCFLLFCNTILLSSLQTNRCSPEYCNFAGDCRIVNNKPNCSCYTEAFDGKYCENVKNLCLTEKNKCTREQHCIPYVGQTICMCKHRSGNSSCIDLETTKSLISHNFRAVYGIMEFIILSFENLGTGDLEITVSTPTYMIAHVPRSNLRSTEVSSKHTKNLTATLYSLGIRRHMKIPYDDAHYFVFQAKYFKLGANQLNTIIKSFNTDEQWQPRVVQNLSLVVYVTSPSSTLCMPQITLPHTNPQNPKLVFVERFTNIQAILIKRCYPSITKYHIHWTISSFDDRVVYYHSEVKQTLLLKIPRYALWYSNLVNQFPNLLLSVRISFREIMGAWIRERCYIIVTARNVEARIAGGSFRMVARDQSVLFDGSKSREPGRKPYVNQHLTYTWILGNIDGTDIQYIRRESNNSIISIPANKLKRNSNNRITLIVFNKFNKVRTHTTSQDIQVVTKYNPLDIQIQCVKNCEFNIYNPDQVLHLRAICKDCESEVRYLWTVNAVDIKQNKQRFVKLLDNNLPSLVTIELKVSDKKSKGVTRLQFERAEAPTGGDCTIDPPEGLECLTNFHIKCTGYATINQRPISYNFRLGTISKDFNYSGETIIHLRGNESLTISICGPHFYCEMKVLNFSVNPMGSVPSSHQVARMLEMGNREEAFCLQEIIINTKDSLKILDLYTVIGNDISPTLLEALNNLEIAQKLTVYIDPLLSFEWFIIMHVLIRVNVSIDYIRNDTEIFDMEESSCFNLFRILTGMANIVQVQKNKHLRQELIKRIIEDPFSEEYLFWNRLGASVAVRVFRYFRTMKIIYAIFRKAGQEAKRFVVPEQPFDYLAGRANCRLEMHDEHAPIYYTSNGTNCLLNVPFKTVLALRKLYKTSQLLLQTWCFEHDLFWWAPERWPPSTAILSAFISGGNEYYDYRLTRRMHLEYHVSLRHDEKLIKLPYVQTDEIYSRMVTYQVNIAAYASLVVTFLSTTATIQVVITMNRVPTLNDLKESNCFVPTSHRNKTIILRNRCDGEYMAYIGVHRADTFDTSRCEYTFSLSAMYCSVWGGSEENKKWIRGGCSSENLEQSPEFAKCQVHHLATCSATEYPIKPVPLQKMHYHTINIFSILFHVFVFVGGALLIFSTSIRFKNRNHNLMRVIKTDQDAEPPYLENVIVHLRTGGMLLAMTTANIRLVFISDLGRYKVIIYQNPLDPNLKINTSCVLRLSEERVQLPCRLTISHDVSGRYPTWFCRSIQIDDLRQDKSFTFHIHSWIKRNQKIRVSCYPHEMSNPSKYNLHLLKQPSSYYSILVNRFRYYSKFYYINWFWMQPVMGPWRYSDYSCNICERTGIWLCKTILTIAIVFCYYGKSEHTDRISLSEFLALFVGSYVASTVFELLLRNLRRK